MSERPCPRCHTLLVNEDSGTLIYCSHCGAPQVQLSEELREQATENSAAQGNNATAGNFAEAGLTSLDSNDPTAVDWTEAVRVTGLGGVIALGLGLLSMAIPPLGYLSLLWALVAPIVVLGIYCSRRKQTRIFPGFGARLGLLTGLVITVSLCTVDAIKLILLRFALNHGEDINAFMASVFAKLQEAPAGQPPLPFVNGTIPEFRVGTVLFFIGFGLCFYLIYAVISGTFGGFLRSRSRTA